MATDASSISESSALAEELTCPICLDIPSVGNSLHHCKNGHNICARCFDALEQGARLCPICRCKYDLKLDGRPQRNKLADILLNRVDLHCKNYSEGCTFKSTCQQLAQHEEQCVYNQSLQKPPKKPKTPKRSKTRNGPSRVKTERKERNCPDLQATDAQSQSSATGKLWEAARDGRLEEVREVLLSGSYAGALDYRALDLALLNAAWNGQAGCLGLLLAYGARANARQGDPICGRTSLHLAAERGHSDCASILLSYGADVSARTETGLTPFMWAAKYGRVETMAVLAAGGADPEEQDNHGRRALHFAAASGSLATVKLLLEDLGVEMAPIDHSGKTPADLAGAETTVKKYMHFKGQEKPRRQAKDAETDIGKESRGRIKKIFHRRKRI